MNGRLHAFFVRFMEHHEEYWVNYTLFIYFPLINFAHLDLNQSFLRNWHSTDTFFLAMCWGGGVRTGTFFGHTQLDYKLNISDKFKKIRPVVSEEMRQRDCYSIE